MRPRCLDGKQPSFSDRLSSAEPRRSDSISWVCVEKRHVILLHVSLWWIPVGPPHTWRLVRTTPHSPSRQLLCSWDLTKFTSLPSAGVISVSLVNHLKEVSSSSSSTTSVITLICSKNIQRDGGNFDSSKEGKKKFLFLLFQVVLNAKRDSQLLLDGDVGCFFLLCQLPGLLQGD